MTAAADLHPHVGDEVKLLTGTLVGRVVAVHERSFNVARDSALLTLDMASFYGREEFGVTRLICDLGGLQRYMLGQAPLVGDSAKTSLERTLCQSEPWGRASESASVEESAMGDQSNTPGRPQSAGEGYENGGAKR
jgi:hypothetical protein